MKSYLTVVYCIILTVSASFLTAQKCPPVRFNNIISGSPYNCTKKIELYALDSSGVGGYITPGFSFVTKTDAFAEQDNYIYFLINGAVSDTLLPMNNATYTVYGQYMSPKQNYSLRWCDRSADGVFEWRLIDHAGNTLIGNGSFDHGATQTKCFTIQVPKIMGTAEFSGVGVITSDNGEATFNPVLSGPGIFDITYSWDDWHGCRGNFTQTITVAGPKAEAGKDVYICRGETAKIGGMPTATGGSGNYRYIWSPASSLNKNNISNPEATPDHTTEYVLTVTDNSGQGCKDRDTVTVTIKNNPDVRASADTSVCIGGTVIITAHGGIKYLWNTLDTLSALTLSPESTSQYFVTITDTAYCSSTESVKITVSPLPEASFTPGFGNTPNKFIFSNTSTGASSYSWDFGDGDKSKEKNPSHHYTDSKGKHRVTLIADNGPPDYCTDTFSLEVISSGITKIPDIFFPKNSHNKEFAMEATGITELEVSIFNRWGNKISERKSIDYIISSTGEQNIVLWDGRIEGISEAEAGVYFYILSATGADSRTFEFHGTVTLIR